MRTFSQKVSGLAALSVALFFASFLAAPAAQAVLEVNVGYEGIASNSGGGNWTRPNANFSGAYGFQADVRLNFPTSPWNVGVRYTDMGLSASYNSQTLAMSNSCFSGLVGYRFINTFLLFGPVVTYGISNNGTLQNSAATTGSNTSTASSVTQYTAGVEIGIKEPLLISAEAGYGNIAMSGFSNNQQLNSSNTNVSIGGLYLRGSIGFSF